MAAEAEDNKLRLVMFPWLAFGHLLPFLELSKYLAQKGHQISFVSTSRNIDRLPKIPPNLSPLINLVKLTLPQVDNLPENAEATVDLPYDKVQFLKKALDGLEGPFTRFLDGLGLAPDWIIYDFASHWVPPIAAKHGIPCAYFCIYKASTMAFISGGNDDDTRTKPEHFTVPPKWVPFPSTLAFRLHEVLRLSDSSEGNASGVTDMDRFKLSMLGCDIVVARSCMELEGDWFHLLEEVLCRKPVLPIGLLPPPAVAHENDDEKWGPISEWLQKQREGSVVYVALGSEATLSQEEIMELALGLELSALPFFWVLRRPSASAEGVNSIELPAGFEERTESQGVVWMGWVPQLRILAHTSVGGFLTHSGWSSVIEGLAFGCALILLPFASDQGLNARLLEERRIGLEIPRGERDGFFTRESVAETLRLVMVDEEGSHLRSKAKEMRELFGDKERHDRYIDAFEQYLQDHRRPKCELK